MRSKAPLLISLLALIAISTLPAPRAIADGGMTLTILHHNDASSRLLPRDDGSGSVARFKALVDAELSRAQDGPDAATLVLSAGNSIEAGPLLEASVEKGPTFYDALAMGLIPYDAAGLGDQDFGRGPDVLAAFLCGFVLAASDSGCETPGRSAFPFLAANLDFTGEPALQALVESGGIAGSTIVRKGEHRFGIVGVTEPDLHVVSSPRGITVMSNTALVVQREVDALVAQGVTKVILVSQLQSMEQHEALVSRLTGVDVVIAGGAYEPDVRYPIYAGDRTGVAVPIATVESGYTELGRLVVEFDAEGNIARVDPASRALAVGSELRANPILVGAVERPVRAFLDSLAATVVATSEVALDGRTGVIRTRETNLGNLMADAALWQAQQIAPAFGVSQPTIAILNAGGFRLEALRPPGALSRLDTYEIAPFASFIAVVEDVSAAELKLLLENALSKLPGEDGRFAQIAGFNLTYDPLGEPLTFDASGAAINQGARVLSIQLDDGTYLVQDGAAVPGAPPVSIATIDFLARGGDEYPFSGDFTVLGVTYQHALETYLTQALAGLISATDYPESGEGRILVDSR